MDNNDKLSVLTVEHRYPIHVETEERTDMHMRGCTIRKIVE